MTFLKEKTEVRGSDVRGGEKLIINAKSSESMMPTDEKCELKEWDKIKNRYILES